MSAMVCDWVAIEFLEQASSSRSDIHTVQVKGRTDKKLNGAFTFPKYGFIF